MNEAECYYYIAGSGKCPVREFIESLDSGTQRKFVFAMGLLQAFGHKLPEPHAKYLGDDIFELRFKGREGSIRILYFFFHREKAIFTNGFIKKTDKVPAREKNLAVERRKNYFNSVQSGG